MIVQKLSIVFGWKFAAMFLLAASYGVTVYADLDDGVRAPLAAVVAAAAVIAANERSEHSKVTELGLQSIQSIASLGAGWFWLRDATGENPDRLVVALALAIAVVVIGAWIRIFSTWPNRDVSLAKCEHSGLAFATSH